MAVALAVATACAPAAPSHPSPHSEKVGVLLMAHGGGPEWNTTVEDAVAPLRSAASVTVAFGMADRATLQQAIRQLEADGVTRVVVVRLFVSSESFLHNTEYLLGVRPDPPPLGDDASAMPDPVERKVSVALSRHGLSESARMGTVLVDRVRGLSVSPEDESVLILAHGMAGDSIDRELVSRIDGLADLVRASAPYRAVQVETLREDWEERRVLAEQRIRAFVEAGTWNGGRVIVVPFRVAGFGPYRDVLAGMDYVADGTGLIPHPEVTEWIREQAGATALEAGWRNPFDEAR